MDYSEGIIELKWLLTVILQLTTYLFIIV